MRLEGMKGLCCFYSVVLVLFLAVTASLLPAEEAGASADFHNVSTFSLPWHAVDDEFAMDSEASRRILKEQNKYIGYRAVGNSGKPAPKPAPSGKPYTPNPCGRTHYRGCHMK